MSARELVVAIRDLIDRTPEYPECTGERQFLCAGCISTFLTTALMDPQETPLHEAVGSIPIFSANDVQSLITAAITVDRTECECPRTDSSILILPI
jgi:hypothetical protein